MGDWREPPCPAAFLNSMGAQPASVERVRPQDSIDLASALLRDVWPAPCLDHTADYVRFHTILLSSLDPIALVSPTVDGRLGAFAAATGRRSSIGYGFRDRVTWQDSILRSVADDEL
jgi:hypothetical protein